MGQKVHPTGIRLGIVKDHTSVWYAEGEDYANNLHVDLKVRAFIQKKLAQASVSRIDIHRQRKLRASPSIRLVRALSSARKVRT